MIRRLAAARRYDSVVYAVMGVASGACIGLWLPVAARALPPPEPPP